MKKYLIVLFVCLNVEALTLKNPFDMPKKGIWYRKPGIKAVDGIGLMVGYPLSSVRIFKYSLGYQLKYLPMLGVGCAFWEGLCYYNYSDSLCSSLFPVYFYLVNGYSPYRDKKAKDWSCRPVLYTYVSFSMWSSLRYHSKRDGAFIRGGLALRWNFGTFSYGLEAGVFKIWSKNGFDTGIKFYFGLIGGWGGWLGLGVKKFYPPKFVPEVVIEDSTGDGVFTPSEKGKIILKVKNEGKGPSLKLKIFPEILTEQFKDAIKIGKFKMVKRIKVGAEHQWEVPLRTEWFLPEGECEIAFKGIDAKFNKMEVRTKIRAQRTPPPELYVEFKDKTGDGILTGEESGEIKVSVQNVARTTLYGIKLICRPDKDLQKYISVKKSVVIGKLSPRRRKEAKFDLRSLHSLPTGEFKLTIVCRDARGRENKEEITIKTQKLPAPDFEVEFADPNNSGYLEAGEEAEILLKFKNKSIGTNKNIVVNLSLKEKKFEKHIEIPEKVKCGDILSGKEKRIPVKIKAGFYLPDGEITIVARGKDDLDNTFEKELKIRTKSVVLPEMIVEFRDENKNSALEPSEKGNIFVVLKNRWALPNRGIKLKLNIKELKFQKEIILQKFINVGTIKPGAVCSTRAFIVAKPTLPEGEFTIKIEGEDFKGNKFSKEITIPTRKILAPELSVSFADASGDGIFDAGEEGVLKLKLKNVSGLKHQDVVMEIKVKEHKFAKDLKFQDKVNMGDLLPDEEKEKEIKIVAKKSLQSGEFTLLIKGEDKLGVKFSEELTIRTKALPPLALTPRLIDERKDGVLEAGEKAEFHLEITNSTPVKLTGIKVYLMPDVKIARYLKFVKSKSVGSMEPGATDSVKLPVRAFYNIREGEFPLTFKIETAEGIKAEGKYLLKTKKAYPPEMYVRFEDESKDGVLSPGEKGEVKISFKNTSFVRFSNVRLTFNIKEIRYRKLVKIQSSRKIKIEPQSEEEIAIPVSTKKKIKEGQFTIAIDYEDEFHHRIKREIKIEVKK